MSSRIPLPRGIEILGLGGVAVDDFIYVDAYPEADDKAQVRERRRQCGGLTATALVAAARLGTRCAYGGVLGTDELSQFALDSMKKEGIDVSPCRRTAGARPIYSNIVVSRRNGTRNIFYDLDRVVGAGTRTPAAPIIRSCRVLFVDNIGVAGALRATRIARQASIPVVADFDGARDPQFGALLNMVDHLIISQPFARTLTGRDAPERALKKLWNSARQLVAITQGEGGCWYLATDMGEPRHQPAFQVNTVDTTGCGDVFHGAYAAALVQGMAAQDRIRFASAAAALKATKLGGQAGIPTLKQLRKFMQP